MQESQPSSTEKPAISAATRRLYSEDIFAGEKQVLIEHGDAEYLLRITRQGKLILTK
jgi:hemin uptake protein HemP